jgi:tetratricopeptide (TPR) repeat protein
MLAELDKSFLERLLDQPKVPQADIERFGELAKQFRSGDFAGTVATYKSLPPALRETKLVTAIYLGALQRGNDDAGYKAALKQAAAKFKTANFQFMLVDMYYLDKEYDKAAGCVDAFMQAVGKDAALLALKSLMLNAKGDVPAARAALGEALQLEPDCVYAHAKGLDVLLAARDFPAVRDSMIFLEKNAGYNFRGALKGGIWADFKQAPESAQWR